MTARIIPIGTPNSVVEQASRSYQLALRTLESAALAHGHRLVETLGAEHTFDVPIDAAVVALWRASVALREAQGIQREARGLRTFSGRTEVDEQRTCWVDVLVDGRHLRSCDAIAPVIAGVLLREVFGEAAAQLSARLFAEAHPELARREWSIRESQIRDWADEQAGGSPRRGA